MWVYVTNDFWIKNLEVNKYAPQRASCATALLHCTSSMYTKWCCNTARLKFWPWQALRTAEIKYVSPYHWPQSFSLALSSVSSYVIDSPEIYCSKEIKPGNTYGNAESWLFLNQGTEFYYNFRNLCRFKYDSVLLKFYSYMPVLLVMQVTKIEVLLNTIGWLKSMKQRILNQFWLRNSLDRLIIM